MNKNNIEKDLTKQALRKENLKDWFNTEKVCYFCSKMLNTEIGSFYRTLNLSHYLCESCYHENKEKYKWVLDTTDWRLCGQEKWLSNEKLIKEDVAIFYKARKEEWDGKNPFDLWDHDHCDFCYEKFMIETAIEQPFAYRSQDYNAWICETCYNDFKEKFNWKLTQNKN